MLNDIIFGLNRALMRMYVIMIVSYHGTFIEQTCDTMGKKHRLNKNNSVNFFFCGS